MKIKTIFIRLCFLIAIKVKYIPEICTTSKWHNLTGIFFILFSPHIFYGDIYPQNFYLKHGKH